MTVSGKLAVIDLGSNTFHLLIVDAGADFGIQPVVRQRIFTGLSKGGTASICEESMEAGLQAIRIFREILQTHGNPPLRIIGTASLRTASNRQQFIDAASALLYAPIEIIDGIREAALIYGGVTLLPQLCTGTHLIMDVGGGSTEFILIRDGERLWSASYALGVGVLFARFPHSEPVSLAEISAIAGYVRDTVADMLPVLHGNRPQSLAGASGSFEVLESMAGHEISQASASIVQKETFYEIYDRIIQSTMEERLQMKGLPAERASLIVTGMILKKTILELSEAPLIQISPYALKEGVLREMMEMPV
jgi:exopolyphosphatase/guanosine-5'-triphosphate,3'-diphosphate pyrophosphatase